MLSRMYIVEIAPAGICARLVWKKVPETRGKTLEQIEKLISK